MMQTSLALKLRVLRHRRGWTLTEAAAEAGIQRQTLAALERGQHPRAPTLVKIAQAYGVPIDELAVEDTEAPALAGKGKAPESGARWEQTKAKLLSLDAKEQYSIFVAALAVSIETRVEWIGGGRLEDTKRLKMFMDETGATAGDIVTMFFQIKPELQDFATQLEQTAYAVKLAFEVRMAEEERLSAG